VEYAAFVYRVEEFMLEDGCVKFLATIILRSQLSQATYEVVKVNNLRVKVWNDPHLWTKNEN
jgi:hypothetical protein